MLTLQIRLPGCKSLKEKRSRIQPLLARLHREFNLSVAETDRQDAWQNAVLTCAMVNSDAAHVQRSLQAVTRWIELNWIDVAVDDDRLEII